jgi:hypothetical protein
MPAELEFGRVGHQAAMQNFDLFAKHPPHNEQRFDQNG